MLAIKNVRLIDGTGKEPVPEMTILIENGRFTQIGRGLSIPENASVIQGAGLTAVPGLIDMHTHVGGSAVFDYPACGNRTETYDFVQAREGFLRWGVTTVRTCGDQVESVLPFRDDANAGKILAPRVVACGPFFQILDGHPWGTVYFKNEVVREKAVEFVDLEESIEDQVDRIVRLGVDYIKAFYPADKSAEDPQAAPRMTFEQLKRVVDRAHMHGLKCACHVDGPEGMAAAAAAGADTIEHAVNIGSNDTVITESMIRTIKESGAVVDPTLIATHHMAESLPEEAGTELRDAADRVAKALYENRVPLAVGCDSGIPFVPAGESLHDELQCLEDIGIPASEILHMATLGNAGILGLDAEVGSIEPGKEADLILLGADPLEKISNTKEIRLVLLRGKVVRDEME